MITLKEKFEAKKFGYTLRAFFVNPFGVPFHKDFRNGEEMEAFIDKARNVGTQLTGFVGL